MPHCTTCVGGIYDILAQSISVLDVTTDIIVCVEFYRNDRMIFFGISLIILCLALVAYDAAFVHFFSSESRFGREIALFFAALPLSPFIPFVFYYADKSDSIMQRLLHGICCFDISFDSSGTSQDASKFKQFFEKKIEKHLGFILESLVEAFPQAILQMTCIVIYNEANLISIISILISLLSVASKSLVFSMGTANNLKQLFFNWLCAVTDFFGIFFVVSWVWYEPQQEELKDAFIIIQQAWLYKLYIFEFPMIGVPGIIGYITYVWAVVTEQDSGSLCKQAAIAFFAFLVFSFFLVAGFIAAILVLEITNWTFIAAIFLALGSSRFPGYHKLSLEFFFTMIEWINSAKKHHIGSKYKGCTSYTKAQDKMMRLCALNYVMNKEQGSYSYDRALQTYLEKHQKDNQYMEVTMKGIRMNTDSPKKSQFILKLWELYGNLLREIWEERNDEYRKFQNSGNCTDFNQCCLLTSLSSSIGIFQLFFAPFYIISRIITLFFPAFITLYLYFGYNVNIWNTDHIAIFQVVMITVYIVLCVILSILFYYNVREQYLMAHILPSRDYFDRVSSDEAGIERKIKKITNHYYGITVIPIRRAIVLERFGPDLGPIIISYLPTDDHFEGVGHVARVKTVV